MDQKIGAITGVVEDVGLYEALDSNSFLIRVLVQIDVNKIIKEGINIGNKVNEIHWIDFRYER